MKFKTMENKKKESIIEKLKKDKVQLIYIAIVSLMHLFIKSVPSFLNIGLIVILIIYILAITDAIYREPEELYFDRITKFTVFVLLNSPLLVYTIILFFKTFPNVLIKVGDANTWIGFAGTIISGSLVMFALIFTLQNERKMKDHEFKLTNIPVIDFDLSKELDYEYKRSEVLKFIIKNIGNNHIRNLKINKMIANVHYQSKENYYEKGITGSLEIDHFVDLKYGVSLIPQGKAHEICLRLNDPNGYLLLEDSNFLVIDSHVSYWNVLVNCEFKFQSTICFRILIKEIDTNNKDVFLKYYSSSSTYDAETYAIKEPN